MAWPGRYKRSEGTRQLLVTQRDLLDESRTAAGLALVGDALFAGSIGRTDFPGSSFETLARSIRDHLSTLPPETRVYPGHGPATTIGREKVGNPLVWGW